ncbi:MAG TPA: tRNA pseudouridine(55) synthase TruB [Acidobacteriota bacterium]|nr:tRNA pseudouridine(55) synthase TruB [Acidobacteriota bacterium]HPB27067.1 tRNA pseudouridine(55) synthase TruB [Acidobacteriota bacterium]HQO25482.1 tRNA pseudouridine(55) synthase TruB [Acidobacteriota bacterium]
MSNRAYHSQYNFKRQQFCGNFMTQTPCNGVLIIDKPAGLTSHDVVARLRGCLPDIKVGHGGTLDPMATGVLPVLLHRATRLAQFLLHADKEYGGIIRFGWATDTHDREGEPLAAPRPVNFTRTDMDGWIGRFVGDIVQLPPAYSAIKWRGRPLYQYARRGLSAPRPERPVRVDALDVLVWDPPDLHFRLACSGGTYVRSIAHELGEMAGCGAHLHSLCRRRLGSFLLEHATALEKLLAAPDQLADRVLPPDSLVEHLPLWPCPPETAARVRNGVEIPLPEGDPHPDGDRFRLVDATGALVAVGRVRTLDEGRRVLRPEIVLA